MVSNIVAIIIVVFIMFVGAYLISKNNGDGGGVA